VEEETDALDLAIAAGDRREDRQCTAESVAMHMEDPERQGGAYLALLSRSVDSFARLQAMLTDSVMVALSVQVAFVMAICAIALAVCCALVSTAELKARPTALYGLGSGEEQDAENSIVTTFEVSLPGTPS
jgi:hypothetical protein